MGGKETSPKVKPLETTTHYTNRLKWGRKHYNKLTSDTHYVAYLDENFFYTTNVSAISYMGMKRGPFISITLPARH